MQQMSHGCHLVRHNASQRWMYSLLQRFDFDIISKSLILSSTWVCHSCIHHSLEDSKHTWKWIKVKKLSRGTSVKKTWFAMGLTEIASDTPSFACFLISRKYLPMYILYRQMWVTIAIFPTTQWIKYLK